MDGRRRDFAAVKPRRSACFIRIDPVPGNWRKTDRLITDFSVTHRTTNNDVWIHPTSSDLPTAQNRALFDVLRPTQLWPVPGGEEIREPFRQSIVVRNNTPFP